MPWRSRGDSCQFITSKRHQTFLHCLVPRENGDLAFPMPSSSAFVHRTITLNIGAGGGGVGEGGIATKSHLQKPKGLCFTLLCARVCGPSDSAVLCRWPRVTQGLWPLQHGAGSRLGPRCKARRGRGRKPQRNPRGQVEETQSFCTCLQLPHKPSYFYPPPPPQVNSDKSSTGWF